MTGYPECDQLANSQRGMRAYPGFGGLRCVVFGDARQQLDVFVFAPTSELLRSRLAAITAPEGCRRVRHRQTNQAAGRRYDRLLWSAMLTHMTPLWRYNPVAVPTLPAAQSQSRYADIGIIHLHAHSRPTTSTTSHPAKPLRCGCSSPPSRATSSGSASSLATRSLRDTQLAQMVGLLLGSYSPPPLAGCVQTRRRMPHA